MQKIISCMLDVNGKLVEYDVVFKNEQYTFTPLKNDTNAPTFNLALDNDWIDVDGVDPNIRQQAMKQLEDYLLSQH